MSDPNTEEKPQDKDPSKPPIPHLDPSPEDANITPKTTPQQSS